MNSKNKTLILTFSLSFPLVNQKHYHKATGTQEYKNYYQHFSIKIKTNLYEKKIILKFNNFFSN